MKIIFIGTVEFSQKMLLKLIEIKAEVVGVITKEKSDFNADFADLTPICKENNIPYIFTSDINSEETLDWIKSLSPDVVFCFGWSSLIKKELLGLPKLGVIGYHPTELPKNRGRHPLIWALALGLEQTASTFFFMDEVEQALEILKDCKVSLLHCTTEYPCPYDEVNLRAMQTLKKKFGLKVGYSDHTQGVEVAIAAVAMGAEIIEKHFTLDNNMEGPDHKASLEPQELKQMITAIRNVEKAMGNGEKVPSKSEIKNIEIVRKSIVAKSAIKKGETLTEYNITTKRPGLGICPMKWDEIVGAIANKDYEEDELI